MILDEDLTDDLFLLAPLGWTGYKAGSSAGTIAGIGDETSIMHLEQR